MWHKRQSTLLLQQTYAYSPLVPPWGFSKDTGLSLWPNGVWTHKSLYHNYAVFCTFTRKQAPLLMELTPSQCALCLSQLHWTQCLEHFPGVQSMSCLLSWYCLHNHLEGWTSISTFFLGNRDTDDCLRVSSLQRQDSNQESLDSQLHLSQHITSAWLLWNLSGIHI